MFIFGSTKIINVILLPSLRRFFIKFVGSNRI